MLWKKIIPDSFVDKKPWYKSEYLISRFDLSKFGQYWGKQHVGFKLSFSIHYRRGNGPHVDEFPLQLLISDGLPPNGHIYIKTVAEGKKIASKIVKKLKNNWCWKENPWVNTSQVE